jgi:phosphocarrier protein
MMLAAAKGSRITIQTEGPDEADAIAAVAQLVAERFGEAE